MSIEIIKIIIKIALFILFLIVADSYCNIMNYKINKYAYKDSKLNKDLNICILSDNHGHYTDKNSDKLIFDIVSLKPDLILIPGDLITSSNPDTYDGSVDFMCNLADSFYSNLLSYKPLENISKACKNITPRIYLSLGNHEEAMKRNEEKAVIFSGMFEKFKEHNITVLDNEQTTIEIDGHLIDITGLSIGKAPYKKFSYGIINERLIADVLKLIKKTNSDSIVNGEIDSQNTIKNNSESVDNTLSKTCSVKNYPYKIVLSHHPLTFNYLTNYDLVVSGHYHGGLVRLPFIGGIITPQLMTKDTHTKGLFENKGSHLLVTAGLGWHSIPIRFNNPSEVVFLQIKHDLSEIV